MTNDRINIVLATDEGYAQHATVAMQSVLANTVATRVDFYLLADGIGEEVRGRMRRTVERSGARLFFIDMDEERFCHLHVSAHLSRATYFRLSMAELLPASVTRAIYLDCDLIVQGDIAELWRTDLGGRPLAAVPDLGIIAVPDEWAAKQRDLGFAAGDRTYFNAGVLIVDTLAWRMAGYGAEVMRLTAEHSYRHHDQDALNIVFHHNYQPLPQRWNMLPPVYHLSPKVLRPASLRREVIAARRDTAIRHYAGTEKPWAHPRYRGFNDRYYDYLAQTEFCDAEMPQQKCRSRNAAAEMPQQKCRSRNAAPTNSIRKERLRILWSELWIRLYRC